MENVTIYDIAEKAGFSPSAVSKALSDSGTLSAKTREHVKAIAREMSYEPNIMARSLRAGRSGLIGIYDPAAYPRADFTAPWVDIILKGFRETMEASGYGFLMLSSVAAKRNRYFDGLLIVSASQNADETRQLLEIDKPMVSVNDYLPGVPIVIGDNVAAGEAATRHLLEIGRKRIAFLGALPKIETNSARERCRGYLRALKEAGMQADPALEVWAETWHARGGYTACAELLSRNRPFDGLFTANNNLAIGAIRCLSEHGVRVPADVAVIGYDDGDGIESFTVPSISSMAPDYFELGKTAADMLLAQLRGEEIENKVLIPVQLMIRESSG